DFHVTGVQTCALPIFAAGDRFEALVGPLDVDQLEGAHPALVVAEELQGVHRVDALAALLVGAGDLVQHRHGRPGLGVGPLGRRLGHDLQLGDGGGALPVGGADAVRAGVAAADDHDVLALGGDRRGVDVALLHPVGLGEVLHGLVHAVQFAAGDGQVAGDGGA